MLHYFRQNLPEPAAGSKVEVWRADLCSARVNVQGVDLGFRIEGWRADLCGTRVNVFVQGLMKAQVDAALSHVQLHSPLPVVWLDVATDGRVGEMV